MPKFWFLLLKRAPVKVALNCFMLLLSQKLLKKESREQLAALKNLMAVQQPARGFISNPPSLYRPLISFFSCLTKLSAFFFGFFYKKVCSLLHRLVELIRACSGWKKIQVTYPDQKNYNIFPPLRSGYLLHFQIRIKL